MIDFLKDQFGPGEVQEVADFVGDALADKGHSLEARWAAREAVADAFGFKLDEDDEVVRA